MCYNNLMKKYLADILTFARFILATALIIMAITGAPVYAGFIVFILGELTDAFDGTLATKYPFPKNKSPWYRKYAIKYDIWADGWLAFATMLFFDLRVNFPVGIVITFAYPITAGIIDLSIYGKFFGHPDDAKPGTLALTNFPLAKKIVLARRAFYLALMFVVAVWMLFASEWPLGVKIAILVVGLIICAFMWFFLSQRRHHITRNAVALEKKLSKKTNSRK